MPQDSQRPTLSVLIVSYNTAALLSRCLDSIRRFLPAGECEVIVVDNGSADGSAEMVRREHPGVRLVANSRNRYFTGGVNQAVEQAAGRYLLLINSDTYFTDDSPMNLVEFMRTHPDCGAAEGLTINTHDGRPSLTARRFCSFSGEIARFSFFGRFHRRSRWYVKRHYADLDYTATWPCDVACNCFMIVPADVFRRMGPADESMLLYYSEDDWARRMTAMGYRQYHVGSARMRHVWRASSDLLPSVKIEAIICHDRFRYLRKYHGPGMATLTTALILLRPKLWRSLRVIRQWLKLPGRVPPAGGEERT